MLGGCWRLNGFSNRLCQSASGKSLASLRRSRSTQPLQLSSPEELVRHVGHDHRWATSQEAGLRRASAAVVNDGGAPGKDAPVRGSSDFEDVFVSCKDGEVRSWKLKNCSAREASNGFRPDGGDFLDVVQVFDHHASEREVNGRFA